MQGLALRLGARLSFSSDPKEPLRTSEGSASVKDGSFPTSSPRIASAPALMQESSDAAPDRASNSPGRPNGVTLLDIPRTRSSESIASSAEAPHETAHSHPNLPSLLMSRATSGTTSSTSSFSRQSSVRSTDSVDAVPLKTPLRTPAITPAMTRHNTGVGMNAVPSYFMPRAAIEPASEPDSSSPVPAVNAPESEDEHSTEDSVDSQLPTAIPFPRRTDPSKGPLSMELDSRSRRPHTAPNSPAGTPPPALPSGRFAPLPLSIRTSAQSAALRISLPGPPTGNEIVANAASLPSTPNNVVNSNLLKPTRPGVISRTASSMSVGVNVRTSSNDFDFGDILGEGSYSTVFSVTDRYPPHRKYALKVLDKRHIVKERKQKYVNIEKDTLNRLHRHPGIVRLFYTFHDERSLYFVLELAECGEILKVIKQHGSFDIVSARFYAAQILSAVGHIHSRGVIHRDLKPENILLDSNMRVKITDFGTAKILPLETSPAEERANSFVGTAEYVSPELLTTKTAFKSSDFWALGCIIYQLIAGKPPFKAVNEYLTFQKIINLEYTFPANFPADAKDLVEKLLIRDPLLRLGGDGTGVEAVQAHPFFASIDFAEIWTCPVPFISSGILPPPPVHTPNFEIFHADNDYFGYQDSDSEKMSPPNARFHRAGESLASVNSSASSTSAQRQGGAGPSSPAIGPSTSKWSTALSPNELLVHSGPITERTGFFSKRRYLILTDSGRLLCIKESPHSVKIKIEILVPTAAASTTTSASPAIRRSSPLPSVMTGRHQRTASAASTETSQILTRVEEDGPKGFKVYTNTKSHRFEGSSQDAKRWVTAIRNMTTSTSTRA